MLCLLQGDASEESKSSQEPVVQENKVETPATPPASKTESSQPEATKPEENNKIPVEANSAETPKPVENSSDEAATAASETKAEEKAE